MTLSARFAAVATVASALSPSLLAACADTEITTTNPSAPAHPPSIPVTSGSVAESVPAAATATSAEACDASNAYVASGNVPPTWTRSGKVTFSIVGNAVTAEEAVDAAGKTVAHDSEKAGLSRETLEVFPARWICQVGAVAVVDAALSSSDAELSKPSGGKIVFDVFRPSVPDEAIDLALLCHEPEGQAVDSSPIARLVGMHAVTQWMTTRHYRALAREVDVSIAEAPSKEARRKVALDDADKVDAQAKSRGIDRCAYATVLRAVAAAK